MRSKTHVATHIGTGHDTVCDIIGHYGGDLHTVMTNEQAYNVPMDRLILLGGADISPFLYGEPVIDSQRPDSRRDQIEWILARRAITEHVPTFGICRGHQMLAAAHGGTLWQDIYSGMGVQHPMGSHNLQCDSKLRAHIPGVTVNSLHHQAVRIVPHGFKVLARSVKDEVIESIWRPGYLGVQWHPELLYPRDRRWLKLFDWWYLGGLV